MFLNWAYPAVPLLCLARLSTEQPCQGDDLSHHVLTQLQPRFVKAVAAQFSGSEASQALPHCFNPPVSPWLVHHSYLLMVSLPKAFTIPLSSEGLPTCPPGPWNWLQGNPVVIFIFFFCHLINSVLLFHGHPLKKDSTNI